MNNGGELMFSIDVPRIAVAYIDTAKYLNISIRSYFRKINLAIESFENELNKLGYNSRTLYKYFGNEAWIMEIKDKFDQEDNYIVETISINKLYNNYAFNRQIHSNLTF